MKGQACFISIDIEATGPTPGTHSMFEIGATLVEEPGHDFSAEITLLPEAGFEQAALDAIGKTRAELERPDFGSAPPLVMQTFSDWVHAETSARGRPVFVANSAPFDWMFVAWYFEKFGVQNPFGHTALDMKAYFMGKTGCDWGEATLYRMAEFSGIPFVGLPHRALDDAIIQGKIFSALLHSPRKTL